MLEPLIRSARRFATHPAASGQAVRVLEAAGAHTLADHVDRIRSGADLVPITVPSGSRALRARRFRMYALDDRDQVVRAVRTSGWLGFEAPLPSVLTRLVRRWPDTMLDVGANTGFYSLVAVTADRHARAIAYEPVPEIVDLLRDNVAANSQGGRITVAPIAIGDHNGTAELHLPPPQVDGTVETSASLDPGFKEEIERVVTVRVHTLDGAWAAAGRPQVSVVKIDTEGVEEVVLAGATQLVAACRPVFTVEILEGADVDAHDRFCADRSYADVALNPTEAVVGRPRIAPHPLSPNHLFVPRERLVAVVDELQHVPRLTVTQVA